MTARNPDIDAFVDKALIYEGNDCLIWPFSKNKDGYAQNPRYGGRISRYVCKKAHGAPPTPKHQAAHSCGNPPCLNRNHLRWATNKENMADDCRGEDCSWTKLTEEQVFEIRKLCSARAISQTAIAKRFSVSIMTINDISFRRRWAWLEEPSDAELVFATTRPRMKDLFA